MPKHTSEKLILNNLFLNPFMEYVRRTYVCRNQIKKGIAGVKDSINYLKKNRISLKCHNNKSPLYKRH